MFIGKAIQVLLFRQILDIRYLHANKYNLFLHSVTKPNFEKGFFFLNSFSKYMYDLDFNFYKILT